MQKHSSTKIEFQLQVQNHKEFEKELSKSKQNGTLLIVDVFADWVGSCKVITPYFQKYYLESNEECPMSFVCLNSDLIIQSVREEPVEKQHAKHSILRRNSSKSLMRTGSKSALERPTLDTNGSNSNNTSMNHSMNQDIITATMPILNHDSSTVESSESAGASLQNNSPNHSNQSPQKFQNNNNNKDDTQRSQWVPLIESLKGKSRPTFLFYKGGSLVEVVKGVNISRINQLLKTLIAEYVREHGSSVAATAVDSILDVSPSLSNDISSNSGDTDDF
ncbi:hypothetical protein C9374_000461 [Naegleria lovaniensis]|uniref:Thioredoxin domain-containing protein n=1 Tax=Naegleria lovaniensis TaxID=51637 RepID=A0AA88GSX7_NAELO|nr:uncharacterized protein C9374_000461 [Naegleria lovaniensis]KAG2388297.1 hypothetical protein C9374_000461 [Naegleria lovaniensis]